MTLIIGLQARKAVWEVLSSDEDMSEMYLTERKAGEIRDVANHQEVEILLEGYVKQLEELANDIKVCVDVCFGHC